MSNPFREDDALEILRKLQKDLFDFGSMSANRLWAINTLKKSLEEMADEIHHLSMTSDAYAKLLAERDDDNEVT